MFFKEGRQQETSLFILGLIFATDLLSTVISVVEIEVVLAHSPPFNQRDKFSPIPNISIRVPDAI